MCKQTPLSIETTYTGIPCALTTEARLSANGMSMKARVAWDTGANVTGISMNVVHALGLSSRDQCKVSSGNGVTRAWLFKVDIDLGNGIAFRDVVVQSANLYGTGIDALIGLDIITRGEFAVNSSNGQTVMTYHAGYTEA